MRILCLTPWWPATPSAQSGNFILDSVQALAAQGHQIKVLVCRAWHPAWAGRLHPDWGRAPLRLETHDPALGVEEISYLSLPRNCLRGVAVRLFLQRTIPFLQARISACRPDVLLVHTEQAAAAAVAAGQASGLPVVTVLHGINTSARLNTATELARVGATLRASARVVLVGAPLQQHFAAIAGQASHFRIVHNGFRLPPESLVRAPAWPGALRFISVSNLHAGKGVDLSLQALARIYSEGHRDWTYTIVGDGPERGAMQALAAALGISEHVHFTGAVAHTAVYQLLSGAEVFVLPSWREAFGVAWLEAMACGLLAVGVRGQGPSAFIQHDTTGLLVEPRDLQDLTVCLRRIIAEPQAMQAIAARGQQRVRRDFTWQAHAEKLAAVCQEAVGAG